MAQQPQDMSFAQALTEAKGVIIQLSGRVKSDADKIRTQQQTIVSQSASIAQVMARVMDVESTVATAANKVGQSQPWCGGRGQDTQFRAACTPHASLSAAVQKSHPD